MTNARDERTFIEGALSIITVLRAGKRPVHTVYCAPHAEKNQHVQNFELALELARNYNVRIEECSREFVEEHAIGKTHGGLIACVGERTLSPAETLFETKNPFLALLLGVEDPYNFGSALRSLYAAGCDGVLLPGRNFLNAAGILIRASAGASELINMAPCPREETLVELCRENSVKLLCAREKRAKSLFETDLSRPLLLVIGGEKRGIPKKLDAACACGVQIPYGRAFFHSLSAEASAAVIAFETLRQNERISRT